MCRKHCVHAQPMPERGLSAYPITNGDDVRSLLPKHSPQLNADRKREVPMIQYMQSECVIIQVVGGCDADKPLRHAISERWGVSFIE
jgi:hypothetical protein